MGLFGPIGTLVASYLIPNTAGFAPVVGTGSYSNASDPFITNPGFATPGGTSSIVLQLAERSIDALGFDGGLTFTRGLTFVSSYLPPGSIGLPSIQAINQNGHNGDVDLEQFLNTPIPMDFNTGPIAAFQGRRSNP